MLNMTEVPDVPDVPEVPNLKKLMKRLQKDPVQFQMLQNMISPSEPPAGLSLRERYQYRLKQVGANRQTKFAKKEHEKALSAKSEDPPTSQSVSESEPLIDTPSKTHRQERKRLSKLSKKFGKITREQYLTAMSTESDPHSANVIKVYHYQNPTVTEEFLDLSDDDDELLQTED